MSTSEHGADGNSSDSPYDQGHPAAPKPVDEQGSNSQDRISLDPASEDRIKALLRGVVKESEVDEPPPDVLFGVQQKLRQRSGGKFYDNAWSTARNAPVTTYFITSLIMLAVLAVAYFVLTPLSGRPETVRNQPAPVEVIPMPRPTNR